ncbi:hypothetical protein EYR41_001734 [Orbilia oligospora]|uniref:Peptide hydrolase n=1 Tax=Orbilia oligospora TaxID=2813651 RepID=A0A8H2E953_ORBOL|nr:hypothetical protein EYR41_001734 [Orbilia oligospora]
MKVSHSTAILLCAAVASAHPASFTSEKFQSLISQKSLLSDLKAFDQIASNNNGNRAFGEPGYVASVNHVKSRLDKSSRFKSWTQKFETASSNIEHLRLTVNGKSYNLKMPLGWAGGEARDLDITAPLAVLDWGSPGTCEHPYYNNNTDTTGKIVLNRWVNCHNPGKHSSYVDMSSSSLGYIFYEDNYEPLGVSKRSLSNMVKREEHPFSFIYMSRADGIELTSRLHAGEELIARFQYKTSPVKIESQNVITETKAGDPNKVILLGAHLDSGVNSSGINDNASGAALLLALFDAINQGKFKPKNKIRFAWWAGGQEYLNLGSSHYVLNLSKKEADNILLYLNFDMVSRGHFGVYDGDGSRYGYYGYPGSEIIEKLFEDYFTSMGLPVRPVHWHGDSDYSSFMSPDLLIKPVGGLHGGDGLLDDACWQQTCDNLANANVTHLEINTKAAAHALYVLSQTYKEVIPLVPYNHTAAQMAGF